MRRVALQMLTARSAEALHLGDDLQCGDEGAQVHGHGACKARISSAALEIDRAGVDLVVGGDEVVRPFEVLLEQDGGGAGLPR